MPHTKNEHNVGGSLSPETKRAISGPEEGKRRFDQYLYHPVIEVVKHAASPLSAALLLYMISKYHQRHVIQTFLRARWIVFKNAFTPQRARGSSATVTNPLSPASPAPAAAFSSTSWSQNSSNTQARTFSTASRTAASSSPMIWRHASAGATLSFSGLVAPSSLSLSQSLKAASTLSASSVVARRMFSISNRALSTASASGSGVTPAVSAPASGGGFFPDMDYFSSLIHNHNSLITEEALSHIYDPVSVQVVLHHVTDIMTVRWMETFLYSVHDITQLPWWGSICVATFFLRLVVFPFQTLFLRKHLKIVLLREEIKPLQEIINSKDYSENLKLLASEKLLKLFEQHRCRPLSMWLMPVLMPPFFLSWFAALFNTAIIDPDLATGGALWFPNLMDPDRTFFLPILSSLSWLAIMESGGGYMYVQSSRLRLWTRMCAITAIPLLATMPSAILCFWIPSNIYEYIRIRLANTDAFRKLFDIHLRSELPPIDHKVW